MCGRITLTNPAQINLRFDVPDGDGASLEPRYNIAPSQAISAITARAEGRVLQQMRWGFRPAWARDDPDRPAPINARAETLLERPLFRGALARGRCLIPADGFYEWQIVPGRKRKQPMYIRLRGGELFGLAGLYSETRGVAGEPLLTCAIVTCRPNDLMAEIHDRMPVLLRRGDEAAWLDPQLTAAEAAVSLLRPYAAEEMEAIAVSTLVNDVRHEGPALLGRLVAA